MHTRNTNRNTNSPMHTRNPNRNTNRPMHTRNPNRNTNSRCIQEIPTEIPPVDAYKKSQQKYHQSDAYKKYKQKYHQSDAYKKYQQKYYKSKKPTNLFYKSIKSELHKRTERLKVLKTKYITSMAIRGLEDDILIYQNYIDNYKRLQSYLKTIEDNKIREEVEAKTLENLAEILGKGFHNQRRAIGSSGFLPVLKDRVSSEVI